MQNELGSSGCLTAERPASDGMDSAFGCPREFLGNRFVYTVISPRARGLSIGINLNPDRRCNFDCPYCEVDRTQPVVTTRLDVGAMTRELERTLDLARDEGLRRHPPYASLPGALLQLRHVALSGDGEPTLADEFNEAVESVVHVRACGRFPFFKMVLITNSSGLNRPCVTEGLRLFTARDEIWVKLEAGTDEYMARVNRADCSLEKVMENIASVARRRPVIVQSLFPSLNGTGPSAAEIEAYAERLRRLKDEGSQLAMVQIYSATRPSPHSECGHLALRVLSGIARRVREVAGIPAEVF